jgi:hypothetical protein
MVVGESEGRHIEGKLLARWGKSVFILWLAPVFFFPYVAFSLAVPVGGVTDEGKYLC